MPNTGNNKHEAGWLLGWIVAVLIAFCAILALALIGGNPPGAPSTIGKWVLDYQTLITGVLAVAAASATIWQMQRTDIHQERRHIEALAVSREGDRRRLERALHPQGAELRELKIRLSAFDLSTDRHAAGRGDPHWKTLSEVAPAYFRDVQALIEILSRPQFTEGEVMFDGQTTRTLAVLLDAAAEARAITQTHIDAEAPQVPGWYGVYDEEFDGLRLFERLRALPHYLGAFIEEMDRMELRVSDYPIHSGPS